MASSPGTFPFPLGQLVGPITVGYVERPNKVWICLDEPRNKIMQELGELQDNLVRMERSKVEVGVVAATLFSMDHAVYRAEVLKIIQPDEVEVRYVDYGKCQTVKINSLFSLPVNLEEAAKMAVSVKVDGIDGTGVKNSEKNRAKITKKLCKESLMAELKEVDGSLMATFFSEGKQIKFFKSKEVMKPDITLTPKEETKLGEVKTKEKKNEFWKALDNIIEQKETVPLKSICNQSLEHFWYKIIDIKVVPPLYS